MSTTRIEGFAGPAVQRGDGHNAYAFTDGVMGASHWKPATLFIGTEGEPPKVKTEEEHRRDGEEMLREICKRVEIMKGVEVVSLESIYDVAFRRALKPAASHDEASVAAKDHRIAELEGALREIRKINVSLLSGGPSDTAALNCRNICDRVLSPIQ